MSDIDRKISNSHTGPGGYRCSCCGPRGKERKSFRRRMKRGPIKQYARREVEAGLEQEQAEFEDNFTETKDMS